MHSNCILYCGTTIKTTIVGTGIHKGTGGTGIHKENTRHMMANIFVACALFCLLRGVSSQLTWIQDPVYEYAVVEKHELEKGYTWYDAQEICASEKAEPLSFYREDSVMPTQVISENVSSVYYWTGANRLNDPSKWTFSDMPRDTTVLWGIGLYNRNHKCAGVRLKKPSERDWWQRLKVHSWKTMNCGDYLTAVICKRKNGYNPPRFLPDPVKVTSNCPEGWIDAGTNRCYMGFEHSTELDWEVAEQTCLSLPYYKPNLACANSREETYILTQMATDVQTAARFWFGLFRRSVGGPWMWTDNTKVDATNFHRYFDQNWDYGGGLIDNRAIPEGSWDLVSGSDGLRALTTMVICQVEKDPNYNHTLPYNL